MTERMCRPDRPDRSPRLPGCSAGPLPPRPPRPVGRPAGRRQDTPCAETNQPAELPKRTLGRTGAQVTILNLGTWQSPGGERLLRFAWANGIRYFDTAKSYGSEPDDRALAAGVPRVPRKRPVPGHQGRASNAPAAPRAARPAARGAPDRLRRPDLRPRAGRRAISSTSCSGPGARSSSRSPRRSASRARQSSSASRATTRAGPSCSRPPPRGGSSTPSWSRTTPGSPRKTT